VSKKIRPGRDISRSTDDGELSGVWIVDQSRSDAGDSPSGVHVPRENECEEKPVEQETLPDCRNTYDLAASSQHPCTRRGVNGAKRETAADELSFTCGAHAGSGRGRRRRVRPCGFPEPPNRDMQACSTESRWATGSGRRVGDVTEQGAAIGSVRISRAQTQARWGGRWGVDLQWDKRERSRWQRTGSISLVLMITLELAAPFLD